MALPTLTRGIQLAFVNVERRECAAERDAGAASPLSGLRRPHCARRPTCRLRAVRLWHQRTSARPSGAPPPLRPGARCATGDARLSGRADYDGTMNAGYVFLGLILVLSLLWVGGYIKLGGVVSLYRRIRLAALLCVVALIAIAATRLLGLT